MYVDDLIKILTKEYPNEATLLTDKSPSEIASYLAKLELIEHIKLIAKGETDG